MSETRISLSFIELTAINSTFGGLLNSEKQYNLKYKDTNSGFVFG